MTRYCGGKKKIAKYLHQVIKEKEYEVYGEEKDYFEPFCGMISVGLEFAKDIEKGISDREIAVCDVNDNIIAMWQELKNGWIPPEYVSETEYNKIKKDSKYSLTKRKKANTAYVGSAFSFGGTMLGMYRGRYQTINKTKQEGKNCLKRIKQLSKLLKYIEIVDSDNYNNFTPKGLVIYCDPPYNYTGTDTVHGNKHLRNFDHKKFWEIMRLWSKDNLVFISEIQGNAPKDFKCIWKKNITRTVNTSSRDKKVECLFIHKIYDKNKFDYETSDSE